MKAKRIIAMAGYLAAWAFVALAHGSLLIDARKLMEFDNVEWEDEMSRLDYLERQLRNGPESMAYIIVYHGRRGDRRGETHARIACIKDYLVNRRGISTDRLLVTNGVSARSRL